MIVKPRRSVLYLPGANARALEKARTLPVDALVLDLEDSVAPAMKADARARVCDAVCARAFPGREVAVRLNGFDTPWGEDDLRAACAAGADAILVPKVKTAADARAAQERMDAAAAAPAMTLWLMMETPQAVLDAAAIAAARRQAPRLDVFVIGANDLAKETRVRLAPGRAALTPWFMQILLAARAHGLDVIDAVYNDHADLAGFRAECEQGRDLGMDGKSLIHPAQIGPCHEVYTPSEADVAWARDVVAAFARPENAGLGVLSLDGRMVERLHVDMARRTLALARAHETKAT